MKKKGSWILLAVLAAFLLLSSGFFLGRRSVRNARVVSERTVVEAALPTMTEQPQQTERVNINTATVEELTTLPQIGETLAERIIAYRQTHGDFCGTSELLDVEGIGQTRYDAIKDYISVG